jgi:hypothetical protein
MDELRQIRSDKEIFQEIPAERKSMSEQYFGWTGAAGGTVLSEFVLLLTCVNLRRDLLS